MSAYTIQSVYIPPTGPPIRSCSVCKRDGLEIYFCSSWLDPDYLCYLCFNWAEPLLCPGELMELT